MYQSSTEEERKTNMLNRKLLLKTSKFIRNHVFCQNKVTSEENLIQF